LHFLKQFTNLRRLRIHSLANNEAFPKILKTANLLPYIAFFKSNLNCSKLDSEFFRFGPNFPSVDQIFSNTTIMTDAIEKFADLGFRPSGHCFALLLNASPIFYQRDAYTRCKLLLSKGWLDLKLLAKHIRTILLTTSADGLVYFFHHLFVPLVDLLADQAKSRPENKNIDLLVLKRRIATEELLTFTSPVTLKRISVFFCTLANVWSQVLECADSIYFDPLYLYEDDIPLLFFVTEKKVDGLLALHGFGNQILPVGITRAHVQPNFSSFNPKMYSLLLFRF